MYMYRLIYKDKATKYSRKEPILVRARVMQVQEKKRAKKYTTKEMTGGKKKKLFEKRNEPRSTRIQKKRAYW